MTESNRTTSEQEKTSNVEPLAKPSDGPRAVTSSPVGVYDQATTTNTPPSSSNLMWIILLIVFVILAFFVLRQWM